MSTLSNFSNPFFGSGFGSLLEEPSLMMPRTRSLVSSVIPSTANLAGDLPWLIKCDVFDGANEFIVLAEIPGVPKDKVDVSIENNVLRITAEKIQQESLLPENFHYDVSEVCFGKDTRRIRIPLNIDQDSAETCIKDGLLCIKFKKLETHAPKKLEIK